MLKKVGVFFKSNESLLPNLLNNGTKIEKYPVLKLILGKDVVLDYR